MIGQKILAALERDGVVILPPMDASSTLRLLGNHGIHATCAMLDPWYNKGLGGELPTEEYDSFIQRMLVESGDIADLIYLWGFPEVIGPYVRCAPQGMKTSAWLTWYYKNCPSVIRGWRSSQQACIQYTREGYTLYPEHFLDDGQKERLAQGKMRFIPGPSSVIEEPLIIGFVGKKERTGHPAQKPEAVFQKLILMGTQTHDIIVDPMAGSGTTGAVAKKTGRMAILCDMSEEYIRMMEDRLCVRRLDIQ